MNYKIGNDIIETERIKNMLLKFPKKFRNKVFTPKEVEYCECKGKIKYQSYAARYAAKEAVFKAISCNLKSKYDISWKDIEILNDKNGRPYVNIQKVEGIESIDISLSHVKEYVMATAIAVLK